MDLEVKFGDEQPLPGSLGPWILNMVMFHSHVRLLEAVRDRVT
jgi:hypothetical protein